MPVDELGATAIVVLSPEADAVVGEIFSEHASSGRDGMTPHITLLVPFVPEGMLDNAVEPRLRSLFSRFEAFDYRFERFASFESVLYLAPEPAAPFVDLVRGLSKEFPDYPPYGGAHDEVVPHLTVADTDDAELFRRLTVEVEPRLPIECRAGEGTLVVRGPDRRWRPRAAFPFGSLQWPDRGAAERG